MLGVLALVCVFTGVGQPGAPPPGLVSIPGGRTQIGIEPRELVRLLENEPNAQNYAGSISAETPRHERVVESFALMVTEVTNEQYLVYVQASGARPPEHWGEAAIRDAVAGFYKQDEQVRTATFDRRAWWRENWRTSSWSIPAGDEKKPVVFVDFDEASAYARWAGLRLPTELEHQRAVRGETTRAFPWGNDWDNEKYAATSHLKKKGTLFEVASFPAGASKNGVFDLAGNVWEWTSSRYVPFPGYERRVLEFGYGDKKRTVNALADFNEAQRVVVGGSFQTSQIMARGSVRRAADPDQSTDALGFRCAASTRPGLDTASAVLESELTANIRPRDANGMIAYAPEACVAVERWESRTDPAAPQGYAVIEGHRFAVFTPVKELPASDLASLEKLSLESGPVALGFFTTSEVVLEPELEPGSYLVAFRARGVPSMPSQKGEPESEPPLEEALALDIAFDHLVFTTLAGRPASAMKTKLEWTNLRESRAEIVPPGADDPAATLRFTLCLAARGTQKSCLVDLPMRFAAGTIAR